MNDRMLDLMMSGMLLRMPSRLPLLEFRRMFQCLEQWIQRLVAMISPVESLHLMNETLHTHRLSRNGPVNREVSAALTRMDLGKDLTKIWRRLDEYVTTDSEERCSKIRMDACEMANRLHVAQTGLAEAVYRREWRLASGMETLCDCEGESGP